MNDHAILKELLNDIENMSVEELKASLADHAYGPVYSVVTFNPYEALFSAYAESIYKLVDSSLATFQKCDFIEIIEKLDTDRKVANRVEEAANDKNFNFVLAA
ncbi:hypothetical protein NB600_10555 [Vibrio antiquarius]|uniref:hypothetical protein n=1 Tax=Vibrio antiquarius (strain Ex25) TaxID=150340 RepID=UPI00265D5E77|nr:hypothetical protein [Vibrio antiquarius]MCR9686255.1 hypothetical protein [Vibrio antiquarius]